MVMFMFRVMFMVMVGYGRVMFMVMVGYGRVMVRVGVSCDTDRRGCAREGIARRGSMRCTADRIRGGNWLADCLAILGWVKVSVRVRFRVGVRVRVE